MDFVTRDIQKPALWSIIADNIVLIGENQVNIHEMLGVFNHPLKLLHFAALCVNETWHENGVDINIKSLKIWDAPKAWITVFGSR